MAERRVAWIDASAGLAGDMLMAALIDAGADADRVAAAVSSLGVGVDVRTEADRRGGFRCLRVHVNTPEEAHVHRHLSDVVNLLSGADLAPAVRAAARKVFELLAAAEGVAHGIAPEQVHFHEVGALDALADVVGCAAALADLGLLPDESGALSVTVSALAAGSGTVRAEHGELAVPAPAVLRIAADAGLELTAGDLVGERTTPTGAALVAALAEPGPFPAMTVRAVGVGGGTHDTADRPNLTRVVVGDAHAAHPRSSGEVLVVEATIDDLDPQLWPSVLDAVRDAGAWDCWTSPTTARHGRPGRLLTALCDETMREPVAGAMFRHTTTLGVRWSRWQRETLPRRQVTITVGPAEQRHAVTVKISEAGDGNRTVKPEVSDVERAARALGVPARQLLELVLAEFRRNEASAA